MAAAAATIGLEDAWAVLQADLDAMVERAFGGEAEVADNAVYMRVWSQRSHVYNMCVQNPPDNHSAGFYRRYGEYFARLHAMRVQPLLDRASNVELHTLPGESIVQAYRCFFVAAKWGEEAYSYLNRYHTRRHNLPRLQVVTDEVVRSALRVRLVWGPAPTSVGWISRQLENGDAGPELMAQIAADPGLREELHALVQAGVLRPPPTESSGGGGEGGAASATPAAFPLQRSLSDVPYASSNGNPMVFWLQRKAAADQIMSGDGAAQLDRCWLSGRAASRHLSRPHPSWWDQEALHPSWWDQEALSRRDAVAQLIAPMRPHQLLALAKVVSRGGDSAQPLTPLIISFDICERVRRAMSALPMQRSFPISLAPAWRGRKHTRGHGGEGGPAKKKTSRHCSLSRPLGL